MTLLSTRGKILSVLLGGAALFAGGLTLAETSFSGDDVPVAAAAAPSARVAVRAVHLRPVRLWSDYPGRMNAVNVAEIRPEVGGRITEVRFRDGDLVKAGDVLFVIDPRPYEVAVARARADLASARTGADLAEAEFGRARKLLATRAASRSLYDQRDNARKVALAAVEAAEAALSEAELALDRAYVKAPIAGRVSRPEVSSATWSARRMARFSPPSSRPTASMPISRSTSRPISAWSAAAKAICGPCRLS